MEGRWSIEWFWRRQDCMGLLLPGSRLEVTIHPTMSHTKPGLTMSSGPTPVRVTQWDPCEKKTTDYCKKCIKASERQCFVMSLLATFQIYLSHIDEHHITLYVWWYYILIYIDASTLNTSILPTSCLPQHISQAVASTAPIVTVQAGFSGSTFQRTKNSNSAVIYTLENEHGTQNWRLGRWFSFSKGWLSGSVSVCWDCIAREL